MQSQPSRNTVANREEMSGKWYAVLQKPCPVHQTASEYQEASIKHAKDCTLEEMRLLHWKANQKERARGNDSSSIQFLNMTANSGECQCGYVSRERVSRSNAAPAQEENTNPIGRFHGQDPENRCSQSQNSLRHLRNATSPGNIFRQTQDANNCSLFINAPNVTSYQTSDGENTLDRLERRMGLENAHRTSEGQEQANTFGDHGRRFPNGTQDTSNSSLFINAPNVTSYQTSDGENTLERIERRMGLENAHRTSEGQEQTNTFNRRRGPRVPLWRRNPPVEWNHRTRSRHRIVGPPQPADNDQLESAIETLREHGCNVENECPQCLICPITCEIMKDPVTLSDGYNYDCDAASQWLQSNARSPLTNLNLPSKQGFRNVGLRSEIWSWVVTQRKRFN